MISPTKEEFLRKTQGRRPMTVHRDALADMETPLSAYWKLSAGETFSFLLESVTGGEQLGRYSLLGVRPRVVLRSKGRKMARITQRDKSYFEVPEGEDPLHVLQREMAAQDPICSEGMPKFVGGAVGLLGYDLVRFFEELPNSVKDDLQVDDMAMMLANAVVVFDHAKNIIRVVVIAEPTSEGYDHAISEIERIFTRLKSPLPPLPATRSGMHPVVSNVEGADFQDGVRKIVDYINAGDCIQAVLSQRLSTRVDAHPLTVYRALRSLNPSPYMFILRFSDYDLVGASPELLVSLEDRTARVRPIAGTRARGATPEEDDQLALELLADEKERAEHIMLVDLGRNDLGRVCDFGSIQVQELMEVERYSHVMHIVSDVTGRLPSHRTAFDLLRASFPAGTVSGAPKVRAMQIIDELELTRRGPYAGAVGFLSVSGDMEMAIAIRTILMKGGTAYVQAGAGIVADSVPSSEFQESLNKAQASLRAIELAQTGLDAAL